jgi:hypothetical protein
MINKIKAAQRAAFIFANSSNYHDKNRKNDYRRETNLDVSLGKAFQANSTHLPGGHQF